MSDMKTPDLPVTLRGRAAGTLALASMLVSIMLLSACGFQLRGSGGQYTLPFDRIYIGLPESSPLAIDLKRSIRSNGATLIAPDAASADGIVDVLTDPDRTRGKTILSLNANGRVSQYQLSYSIVFKVRDNQGHELLAPTTITLTRPLDFNDAQRLAKETEEAMLYRDMEKDLVQQMVRRMGALKPVINASPVATPVATPVASPAAPAATPVPASAPLAPPAATPPVPATAPLAPAAPSRQ